MVSKEFARKDLRMWRDSDASSPSQYVFSPAGLFPAPMSEAEVETEAGKKRVEMFKVLGCVNVSTFTL